MAKRLHCATSVVVEFLGLNEKGIAVTSPDGAKFGAGLPVKTMDFGVKNYNGRQGCPGLQLTLSFLKLYH